MLSNKNKQTSFYTHKPKIWCWAALCLGGRDLCAKDCSKQLLPAADTSWDNWKGDRYHHWQHRLFQVISLLKPHFALQKWKLVQTVQSLRHDTIQKSLNSNSQSTNGPHNDPPLHEEPYARIPKARLPLATEIKLKSGLWEMLWSILCFRGNTAVGRSTDSGHQHINQGEIMWSPTISHFQSNSQITTKTSAAAHCIMCCAKPQRQIVNENSRNRRRKSALEVNRYYVNVQFISLRSQI